MSLADLDASSMSSAEFEVVDHGRLADIERKQALIADFLTQRNLDGLLLTRPSNFAWFTAGGDSTRGTWADVTAALFLNKDARVVLTRKADSAHIFDREIPRLGFQLKERSWQEARHVLLADLCRGRQIGCDQAFENGEDVSVALSALRLPLSKTEVQKLRELGAIVAHAVEQTARTCHRGDTESEIAGQVAHRLLRHDVQPLRLQVLADGHGQAYRHWTHGQKTVHRYCTIAAVGRRHGLHVGVSRTLTFGEPPKVVRDAHLACLLVQATGMFFSQSSWDIASTWQRVQRIYEKFGHGEEWHLADQGCVIGYEASETPIVPKNGYRLAAGIPVMWHPSIGSAFTMDTMLVKDEGFELLTPMANWPQIEIDVKHVAIPRPDMLLRTES